ncbi:unnamed protein product [Paramecium primaurelia]|uniref:CRAL-TRIO domain-containing protein n=1 Tax=Paramecium primaurelia TaxID=5886 RepID=A0A8S1KX91_PARPR|nr:unnamed protein product [Paramecium primaurelia]
MIDFSYLRPPADVYQIKHDSYYIKHGEGKSHVRKIFFHQEFDEYEKQKIKELTESIQQHKLTLPPDWCQELTLKYCYSGGFEISKCIQRLQKHLEWINDENYQVLSPEAEQYLKQGYIYQFGRDPQYRPVVYIQLHLISKNKVHVPTLLNAATAIGNMVTKFMYARGYVENWIVILDSGGSGLFDFPFSTLNMINEFFSINFTSSLHKMFILNPSFFFNSSWKLIEKIIHPETAAKINFLKATDFYKLQELIPAEEIEIKYGGQHPNLTNFWPPINTKAQINQPNDEFLQIQRPPTLTKRTQSFKESEYFSIDNNSKEFYNNSKMKEYRIHEQFQVIDQQHSKCCSCKIM